VELKPLQDAGKKSGDMSQEDHQKVKTELEFEVDLLGQEAVAE